MFCISSLTLMLYTHLYNITKTENNLLKINIMNVFIIIVY